MCAARRPGREEYRTLAEFRYLIRCFLDFSEAQARQNGLTPRQHQALLAIKGFPTSHPTVGDIAEKLRMRHHSAGELMHRMEDAGLILRQPDALDRRLVRVSLSDTADQHLLNLSAIHLEELRRLRPALLRLLGLIGEAT